MSTGRRNCAANTSDYSDNETRTHNFHALLKFVLPRGIVFVVNVGTVEGEKSVEDVEETDEDVLMERSERIAGEKQ